jgi:murein DD-endopeptidase MepM/ murein hydrolase activator NlpD
VRVGDTVERGEQIAKMGMTGTATGVHLHFELIRDGVNIDPAPYLPKA